MDKTSSESVTRTVTYYPAGGAMRINSTLYYILKDHLGSASVITDSTGNVIGEQRYYPFGETRLSTGTIFTDKQFTGQQNVTGLGIYNYNARFYSPKLGRFLSADTIVPGAGNPQNLNRYGYVLNNPLRYIDPSGHDYCTYTNNNNAEDCSAMNHTSTTTTNNNNTNNNGGTKVIPAPIITPITNGTQSTLDSSIGVGNGGGSCKVNSGYICGGDETLGYIYDPATGLIATWSGDKGNVKYNSFNPNSDPALNANLTLFVGKVDAYDSALANAKLATIFAVGAGVGVVAEVYFPPAWPVFGATVLVAVVSVGAIFFDVHQSDVAKADAMDLWSTVP